MDVQEVVDSRLGRYREVVMTMFCKFCSVQVGSLKGYWVLMSDEVVCLGCAEDVDEWLNEADDSTWVRTRIQPSAQSQSPFVRAALGNRLPANEVVGNRNL